MGMFLKVVGSLLMLSFFFSLFGIAQPGDGLIADILQNPREVFGSNFVWSVLKNFIGIEQKSSSVSLESGDTEQVVIGAHDYTFDLTKLFASIFTTALAGIGLIFKRDELIYAAAFVLIMSALGVFTIITAPLPAPLDIIVGVSLFIFTFVLGLDWIRGKD